MQIQYPNFQIILVDNNSSDDSVKFVKSSYPDVRIIQLEKNYGFAEANNIGAKKAEGEYILFLNNDTIVEPNFLNELVKTAESDKNIAICQSFLVKPNGEIDSSGDFVDTVGRAYNSRKKPIQVQKILSARGACMLIRKKTFCDLEGFDQKFFVSFEDVDLGWRAWMWGYKVVLTPTSVVTHLGGQTIKKLDIDFRFHDVKNGLVLWLVNFEFYHILRNIFILSFVGLIRKFGFKGINDPPGEPVPRPPYSTIFKSMFWIIKNLGYVLKKHKKINSKRVRSTNDLIKMGLITKV